MAPHTIAGYVVIGVIGTIGAAIGAPFESPLLGAALALNLFAVVAWLLPDPRGRRSDPRPGFEGQPDIEGKA
jgi:hypothetical protein